MASLLIRGGTVLTMNDRLDIVDGDVLVRDGRIESVGRVDGGRGRLGPRRVRPRSCCPGSSRRTSTCARRCSAASPTTSRLIDWLRTRIWPMEAAHTPASLRASARLAACELLSSGTTSVLTMETVHDTEAVFEEVAAAGLRAVVGKCLMDADAAVPRRLLQPARAAIDESLDLHAAVGRRRRGRIRAAFAPRFAVSCSQRPARGGRARSSPASGVIVHTHASEQQAEIAMVERQTGTAQPRATSRRSAWPPSGSAWRIACGWTSASRTSWRRAGVKVLHCPGSNLKLGSGIAPVAETAAARHLGVARRRRGGLQQPPRHVRGDAPRGRPAVGPPRARRAAGARRGLDGHPRGRPRPGPGGRDRVDRAGQAGRPDRRRPRPAPPRARPRPLLDAGLRGPGHRRPPYRRRRRGAGARRPARSASTRSRSLADAPARGRAGAAASRAPAPDLV
ncbi:MAG: amidohydrolase family protein [Comamonadaceae bacterium]|nr:amidohydrolase family protein [Comamonadaceae bacterium]